MPFSKEKNRRIYITALIISFLLIVASIYMHLKQKTHLGRMSFNLDREHIKPASGVEATTLLGEYDYSILYNKTKGISSSEDNKNSESIKSTEDTVEADFASSQQSEPDVDNTGDKDVDLDATRDKIDDTIEDVDQSSEYEIRSLGQDSNACIRCLCMTVNGCRPTFCGGNPCGLYRISKMYWIDSGKPTIAGGSTDNDDQDYLTCVNEDTCSTAVIRQYYNRYKRDCNKDGVFDCKDQVALHLLGPNACLTENLSYIHANRLKNCLIESNLNYMSYSSEEEFEHYV